MFGTMMKVRFTDILHTQVYDAVHTTGETQIYIDKPLYCFYYFDSGIVYVQFMACNLNLNIVVFVFLNVQIQLNLY
jgi:hypothetical protein